MVITRHGRPIARLVPEPADADPLATLTQLRQLAREQGIAYPAAELTEPLPPAEWGELFGDGATTSAAR